MKNRNNSGYTLIELIIVILILGITVGFGANSILSYRKSAGETVVNNLGNVLDITKAKTQSSVNNVELIIYADTSSKEYIADIIEIDKSGNKKIYESYSLGKSIYTLCYNLSSDTNIYYDITDTNKKVITFNRSTGGYMYDTYTPNIKLKNSSYGIYLVQETGRYFIE